MSSVKMLAHDPNKRSFEYVSLDKRGKLQVSKDIAKMGAINNWLSSVTLAEGGFSTAFNCTEYGQESFISISDASDNNTESWALFGSLDDVSYIFIGLIPRLAVGSAMHASVKINLALFNYIKLKNNTSIQFSNISATVLGS